MFAMLLVLFCSPWVASKH
eukprot:CCRYP_018238-RC/>CCRYP_018238-RC protein AED:0.49 eAED:1.00 QI:0/-1/0/1/-1/0/1/0/18